MIYFPTVHSSSGMNILDEDPLLIDLLPDKLNRYAAMSPYRLISHLVDEHNLQLLDDNR